MLLVREQGSSSLYFSLCKLGRLAGKLVRVAATSGFWGVRKGRMFTLGSYCRE